MRETEIILVPGMHEMFSAHAVRYDDLLSVSGCLPLDADGRLVGRDDLAARTEAALSNLARVLRHAGTMRRTS